MMQIDIEQRDQLDRYLHDQGLIQAGESVIYTILSGGVSNRAVLVQINGTDRWVIKQALHKLRVTVDWFSSPERIYREAAGLIWLSRILPKGTIPDFVLEDQAHHILIMAAVPQPHRNWKTMLLAGEVRADDVEQFARLLATLHSKAYEQGNELRQIFADRHFFETLRLEPYYRYTAEQVPAAKPFLDVLIENVHQHQITLVHGDYSPKNILVHDDKLILLDHEVIHWGDPAFDIGFSMTHLLSKAHHVITARAAFIAAAQSYWRVYQKTSRTAFGADFEARCVHHTLACLLARVAGRSQLEYMNDMEKARQRDTVLHLIAEIPPTIPILINSFIEEIENK